MKGVVELQLKLVGRRVTFLSDKVIGYYKDNLYDTLTCNVDTGSEWTYVLDVVGSQNSCCGEAFSNIISLDRNGNDVSVTFEEGMLPEGKVSMQFRGTNGTQVYVSEIFDVWVKLCLNTEKAYDPVPSEFTQIEQRIQEYNNHPPYPDSESGYWMIWDVRTHEYKVSTIPIGAQLPSISDLTAGKYLSNDGVNAVWVSAEIADKNFVYTQYSASDTWIIEHNLEKYPSVSIVDSGGSSVIGEVTYYNLNSLQVHFINPFSGKAYLN